MDQQTLLEEKESRQQPDHRAIAMLTSNLLGHLGDEADDLGDDDQSGDEDGEGRKPQARKPHLQGRFSGELGQ